MNHTCEVENCTYSTKFEYNFKAHKMIHEIRDFVCSNCRKAYPIIDDLSKYLETDEDERPINCDNCMKSFEKV